MSDSTSNGSTPPPTPLYDQTSSSVIERPTNPTFGDATTGQAGTELPNGGKADAVKEEAASVASDARAAGESVTATVKDQAAKVADEARGQASDLLGQTASELKEQAGVQQQRAAEGLRSVSEELTSMADASEDGGIANELVRNLAGRAGSVAGWLDGRDPGSLLEEVKSFAARKPGTFIALAAGAGILAGRLTKALTAETPSRTTPTATKRTTPGSQSPVRTQEAFADASETIGSSSTAGSATTGIPFDDLLGDAAVPGRTTDEGELR